MWRNEARQVGSHLVNAIRAVAARRCEFAGNTASLFMAQRLLGLASELPRLK
jgi:hypothetical protein